MIITLEQLKKKNACTEALEAFETAVGQQTADIEWNEAAQGWFLASPLWRRWWGWGHYNGIFPIFSMAQIDLSGANLTGADLSQANLSGANLTGANLTGANLRWAKLRGANLSRADLRWATLSGADLSWAKLGGIISGDTLWPEGFPEGFQGI